MALLGSQFTFVDAQAAAPPVQSPAVQATRHTDAEAADAGRQAGPAPSTFVVPGEATTPRTFAAVSPTYVTYRVFATQYAPEVSGRVEAAVPDKCAKFAARGDTATLRSFNCPAGYRTDLDYSVRVARDNGQNATVPIGDVGPWNIDDNYWDPPSGPRPRRLFTDLPQGEPEANAARYNNYNYSSNCLNLDRTPSGHGGGADQFGRCVLNPAGLDLSLAAADRLGLGPGQNEWVTVSFLWEPPAGPTWHDWAPIGGPAVGLTSGVDSASWAPGRLDVFGRGGDNALWHTWFDGSWHAWESLGGVLGAGPGAVSSSPGRLDVFVRGTDSNLYRKSYDGTWHAYELLGQPPGGLTSGVDVESWAPGRLDVFGRGADSALWHTWFDGRWHAWESLGGALSDRPGAVSWSPGRLDVFVRGADSNLWHKWYDGTWHAYELLGRPPGGLTSGVDVASWAPGRIDVFTRGADNGLWHVWYAGGWSVWESLGGGLAGDPGAVSQASGALDVFVPGTDSRAWQKSYR